MKNLLGAFYAKSDYSYVNEANTMTNPLGQQQTFPHLYLLGSRFLTHAAFWVLYYCVFSFIWMKPETGYFASFYLEFILMPVRILAVYCMLYWLIPKFLVNRHYTQFFVAYAVLIVVSGHMQYGFSFLFYETLFLNQVSPFSYEFSAVVRNSILVNTTVILLGTAKIFQLYTELLERLERTEATRNDSVIEVKSDRRIYRLKIDNILFVEGLGNYVTFHMQDGDKKVVYDSLKQTQTRLPANFVRVHRSYLINKEQMTSYNTDEVHIGGHDLPKSKDFDDQLLA